MIEKMLHGQGRRMFWSKPRPKSILIIALAVITTYYLFFSGPGAQFQVVPYRPGERTSQGEPPIVEKILTTPNRPQAPAKPSTKKLADSKIPEPLIIEEDEYNDAEFKIPEKVVPKKKEWELTVDEIKDWKDPTDEEDPEDVAAGYETDGKHREPGELSRLQREKDLRKEWRHHYKVTAKLASSNLIYGNTLSTLEAHEDRSELHRSYLRDDPDVDVSFSVEKPVRFNPYPDYNSDNWKGNGNAPYVPCKGATGSIIEDPLVFKGRPHDWPAPKFGSYSVLNMDGNLCWERETRLGAYGLLEQRKKMGGESEVINWDNVNWGDLQRRCVHKNAKRYDMNKSRKNQFIDVYPEVAAAAQYAEMMSKIQDKETTGKDRYGGNTVPTDAKAKKPERPNDGLSDGERDSKIESEGEKAIPKPKGAKAEETEKSDIKKPEAEKSDLKKSDTEKSEADKKAEADKANADKPDAKKPEADKSDADKPSADKPESSNPAIAEDKENDPSSKTAVAEGEKGAGSLSNTAEDAKETGTASEIDPKKEETRKGDANNADDKLQKRSSVLGGPDPSELVDEFQTFQNRSSSTGYNPETRTAILLRSYTGKKYTENDKQNIRALVSELALKSGGEYEVFLLVQVKDKQLRIFDDPETYQFVLSENIPPEFQGMTILWNDEMVWNIYTEMKDENERSVHTAQWLSVQKFSHDHPQFDFLWNWEMDFRFTGHYYELLDRLAAFGTKQPRKGLWERNERWYIPEYHGDYDTSFRRHIEDKYGNDTIWGAPDLPFVTPVGPKPPVDSPGEDNYEWGVGEAADVITVGPIFNPVHSNWVIANHIWGYHDSTHKAKDLPRRTTIVTQSRISKRLLDIMHIENMRGNHVASEMTPQTVALLHGLKTVYAPHPIFMDRNWDGKYLNKWFNPGQNGEAGGRGSPMGWGRERRYQGSSWYYRAEPPNRMFNNWMGWSDTGIGGKQWEEKHGRPCLPSVMLHPVKDSEPTNEDHATSFELAYG